MTARNPSPHRDGAARSTTAGRPNRFQRVRDAARGRWPEIMRALWSECDHALNETYIARKIHVTCPRHGSSKKKGDGFRFYSDFNETGGGICNTCGGANNGIDLLALMLGTSALNALEMVEHYLGMTRNQPAPQIKHPPPEPQTKGFSKEEVQKRANVLTALWEDSLELKDLPDDHHAILYYAKTRGIDDLDYVKSQINIRYNPGSSHYLEGREQRNLPMLVGLFQNAFDRAIGVHRTFLDRHLPEKASIGRNKALLKRLDIDLMNGGVRLLSKTPATSHTNICEGIENAMSIGWAIGRETVAATTGTLLAGWLPNNGVKYVTIWADFDALNKQGERAGSNYANTLKNRLEEAGIKVRILYPSSPDGTKLDWNDILRTKGKGALIEAYEERVSSSTI